MLLRHGLSDSGGLKLQYDLGTFQMKLDLTLGSNRVVVFASEVHQTKEYYLVQVLAQMVVQHEDQVRKMTASTLLRSLGNNRTSDYRLVRHPMKEFYLDDQLIHFDLIENYKYVIVMGLALAGSEVMSFFDENLAKLE